MPFLNYVTHCVISNRTTSCAENSVRSAFNRSWQTSPRRDPHTSLFTLQTTGLTTFAHSMSPLIDIQQEMGISHHLSDYSFSPCRSCPFMDKISCEMGLVNFVFCRGTLDKNWSNKCKHFIVRRNSSVSVLKKGIRSKLPRGFCIRQ